MFCATVTTNVNGLRETFNYFADNLPDCQKFVRSFPNPLKWSISPCKLLSPIIDSGKVRHTVNCVVDYRSNKERDIYNEFSLSDLGNEVLANLDPLDVYEIKIRVRTY